MNVYFLSKLSKTDHVSHDGGSVIREENRAKKGWRNQGRLLLGGDTEELKERGEEPGDIWVAGGRVLQGEGIVRGPCLACLRTSQETCVAGRT